MVRMRAISNIPADEFFMERQAIIEKFGSPFAANERTYKMGIDIRFTEHLALRFRNRVVLETCSGGGFTTISLAKQAAHVYSFDIDQSALDTARANAALAGVDSNITFLHDDIFHGIKNSGLMRTIDASFIDPDWADTGTNPVYSFVHSQTQPPSDRLLEAILNSTPNVTLVQPPFIPVKEFAHLPTHELERLFIDTTLELYCLHFGELASRDGDSEYTVGH